MTWVFQYRVAYNNNDCRHYRRVDKMLKIKFMATLGIVASLSCVANPVSAQGSRNIDGKGYTITGDSLTGINQSSSYEDFPTFFTTQTSDP